MSGVRRLPLLAVMAIAAMAFAAPGVATAANWTIPALDESVKTSFSGSIDFDFEFEAGVTCDVKADVTLQPGKTGSLNKLDFQACSESGLFQEYECGYQVSAELPTGLKAKSEKIELEYFEVNLIPTNCGGPSFQVPLEAVNLIPDDPQGFNKLTLSSKSEDYYLPDITATLTADQPGIYGIGGGGEWIDTGSPALLKTGATVEVDGELGWEVPTGGYGVKCGLVQGELELLPEGKADLGLLDVHPGSCVGFGPHLYGCQPAEYEGSVVAGTESPIQATSEGNVLFDELVFFTELDECVPSYAQLEGEVTAVPDNPNVMSRLVIGEDDIWTATPWAEGKYGRLFGYLDITPAGKYGIDY